MDLLSPTDASPPVATADFEETAISFKRYVEQETRLGYLCYCHCCGDLRLACMKEGSFS
jgi:hypothetical protein